MKTLIWMILLFAAAIGLALTAGLYEGNIYIVSAQTMLRINLHTFLIGLVLVVILLYLLISFIAGLLNIPGRINRFFSRRREKNIANHLNAAGLAYFEGRYQKARQQADKVLSAKKAGDKRTFALMLAAHAADAADQTAARSHYLQEIEKLPEKSRLSYHLLQIESALSARDYTLAAKHIEAAHRIIPGLTKLVKLQLRYAFDTQDAAAVLNHTTKLKKAAAINENELAYYQEWAYRLLLSTATDAKTLEAVVKQISDPAQQNKLSCAIAETYQRLSLHQAAVNWVKQHYPHSRNPQLLTVFSNSVRHLETKAQNQALSLAESWLQQQPDDAALLLNLGLLAYHEKLWGKAQSYLEAGLSLQDCLQSRLLLAKVFDQSGQPQQAQIQRQHIWQHSVQPHNGIPSLLPAGQID